MVIAIFANGMTRLLVLRSLVPFPLRKGIFPGYSNLTRGSTTA